MAEYLDKALKRSIADAGWKYKTFDAMYVFMRRRFEVHGAEKLRILYNDPLPRDDAVPHHPPAKAAVPVANRAG